MNNVQQNPTKQTTSDIVNINIYTDSLERHLIIFLEPSIGKYNIYISFKKVKNKLQNISGEDVKDRQIISNIKHTIIIPPIPRSIHLHIVKNKLCMLLIPILSLCFFL